MECVCDFEEKLDQFLRNHNGHFDNGVLRFVNSFIKFSVYTQSMLVDDVATRTVCFDSVEVPIQYRGMGIFSTYLGILQECGTTYKRMTGVQNIVNIGLMTHVNELGYTKMKDYSSDTLLYADDALQRAAQFDYSF